MSETEVEFLPIALESISVDSICEFDLYKDMAGKMRLFRRRGVPVEQKDLDNLRSRGHEKLFVPEDQKGQLLNHMISRLPNVLQDESIPAESRLEVLTETSVGILDQILTNPTSKQSVKGMSDQCQNHVELALQGDDARRAMAMSVPQARRPVSHAIGVGNLSILLGLRCGITDPKQLHELGVGAVLHEVGKRLLDQDYYVREDVRITSDRMRGYPLVGKKMLETSGEISAGALRIVLEHQERLDGSGFPSQLKGNKINVPTRIVAICDYFDESVNSRSSKRSMTPFMALMQMKEAGNKFDRGILVEFIHLLGSDLPITAMSS